MRRNVIPLAMCLGSLAGLIAGGAYGMWTTSLAWLSLSLPTIVRWAAIGWLIGIVLAVTAAWVLTRRTQSAAQPAAAGSGLRRLALSAAALAPASLWVALPFLLSASHPERSAVAPRGRQPNIILISIDTLRADHVGAYGDKRGLTPAIDRFARDATSYESAIAPGPWTLPSLGSVFTHVGPSECGMRLPVVDRKRYVESVTLVRGIPLLSERLQQAGYVTAAEIANAFLGPERGWSRGFDYFRNEGNRTEPHGPGTRASNVTRKALSWLALNRREPFFLWVHYLDPHVPYDSPETPAGLLSQYPRGWKVLRKNSYAEMQSADPKTKARFQQFCRSMYAEEVRYADKWVGRLLRGIRESGVRDDALIVITADHGEELFDHGSFEHGHSMHAELLRVPLLVKWPRGTVSDRTISQTVPLADLGGTILSLASARSPAGSPWQTLPRRDGGPGAEVYSEGVLYGTRQAALTTDTLKVICHPEAGPKERRFEVFTGRDGVWERRDGAAEGEAADMCRRVEAMDARSQRIAEQLYPGGPAGAPRRQLTEDAKRNLRSLGYLGN